MVREIIKDSFKWSKKFYIPNFGVLIATVYFGSNYFKLPFWQSALIGVGVFCLGFLLRCFILFVIAIDDMHKEIKEKTETIDALSTDKSRKKTTTGNNVYGEAILLLKDGFAIMHQARKNNQISNDELAKCFVFMCEKLKEFFDRKTNSTCGISIKILAAGASKESVTENTEIETLCRDTKTNVTRNYPPTLKHNIFENTCFYEIFHNIGNSNKAFYLNNDLPEDKYYKNTSDQVWGKIDSELSVDERRKTWKLPYCSEIVVPITPQLTNDEDRKKQFLGFICVDSSKTNSFHFRYDVGMMLGVADGVYDMIKLWIDNRDKIN